MKHRNVQAYPIKNVPDHLVHECSQLGFTIALELASLLEKHDPNIVLGAIAFFHAATIKNLVSDDVEELIKASQLAAIALLKNVEILTNLKEKEDEKT